MEIISRKVAKEAGLNKYFTGEICRNGHISYRYTQSGTCAACIRAGNMPVDDPEVQAAHAALLEAKHRAAARRAEEAQQRINEAAEETKRQAEKKAAAKAQTVVDMAARGEAKSQLVQIKVHLHAGDLEVFKAAAYAMALAHFPVLTVGDVYPGLLPANSGSSAPLYKFNCHADDIEQLRGIEASLHKAHPRAVPAWEVDRYIKVDPVPDWADRP